MTNGEKYKTAQERALEFSRFCQDNSCSKCVLKDNIVDDNLSGICAFKWLDLEAEDEKPLPCPFCGSLTFVGVYDDYYVQCEHCGYMSMNCFKREKAIAAHNRVAKIVKESEANHEAR